MICHLVWDSGLQLVYEARGKVTEPKSCRFIVGSTDGPCTTYILTNVLVLPMAHVLHVFLAEL